MITIGIDPHKSSHTAVAIDATGHVLGELRVAASKTTLQRLLRWAERWPDRIWAVEGATGLGHLLAQRLVASQETVRRAMITCGVSSTAASSERRVGSRRGCGLPTVVGLHRKGRRYPWRQRPDRATQFPHFLT